MATASTQNMPYCHHALTCLEFCLGRILHTCTHSHTHTHTLTCSTDFTAGQRDALKEQLTRIILRLLAENKELHYYQGLHDIALTLLLVAGEDLAYAIMAVITRYHIR